MLSRLGNGRDRAAPAGSAVELVTNAALAAIARLDAGLAAYALARTASHDAMTDLYDHLSNAILDARKLLSDAAGGER
jgi:hypothetical protein